jgi:hypothetical protein
MGGITRNYIVRVYRLEKNNPRTLVGVVEEPEKEGKQAFTCLDELWGILNTGRVEVDEKKGESGAP